MAHVHGAKLAEAGKHIAEGAAKPMMEAGMGGMMNAGMKGMMEHGAGMGMGNMMSHRAMTAGVATGAAAVTAAANHSLLRRVATHPLVMFGLGLAVGYWIHKYREEIIESAEQVVE
jgi:hypothetical protein